MIEYILEKIECIWVNKEWIFSGIGILLITTVAAIVKKFYHRLPCGKKIPDGNGTIQNGTIRARSETDCIQDLLMRTIIKARNDAETVIRSVEESYIKTENYWRAEKQLRENDILILTGYPMMGKTETAFALLYKFHNQFAVFSLEGVDELLEYLKDTDDKKELFFIDDLLGQRVYDYPPEKVKCLRELIDIVLKSNGKKKLILTVKETVLKDFYQRNPDIKKLLDLHSVPIIDINYHSSEIRIEYIKESLERTIMGLDREKAEFLCEKESLNILTESICFTPLVVNRLLKPQKEITLDEYKKQFYSYMTDADFIWKKELDALNEYSLLYLYTIYSLTDKMVSKEIADKCFRELVKEKSDYKFNIYEITESMKGILVNIQGQKSGQSIGLMHPTLNEYIDKHLPDNQALEMARHACYLDQLERLEKYAEDLIKQKLRCPREFFSLGLVAEEENTFNALMQETKPIIYAKYLLKYNIRDKRLKNEIIVIADSLLNGNNFSLMRYENIVVSFFLSDFYDMGIYLNNTNCFQRLLGISSRENISRLLEKRGYYKKGVIDYRELAEKESDVAEIVRRGLEEEAESAVILEAEELLDNCCQEMFNNEEDIDEIIEQIAADIGSSDSLVDVASQAFDEAAKKSRIIHCEYDVHDIIDNVIQEQPFYDMIQEKVEEARDDL